MSCLKWLKGLFSKPKLKFRKEYHFNDDFSKDAKDSPLNNIETAFPINGNNGRIYSSELYEKRVKEFEMKKLKMKVPVGDGTKKTIPKIFMPFKDSYDEHEN